MSKGLRIQVGLAPKWVLALLLLCSGCVSQVQIVPVDEQRQPIKFARVSSLGGAPLGVGPTTIELSRPVAIVVDAGEAYLPARADLEPAQFPASMPPQIHQVPVLLRDNVLHRLTVADSNRVVNQWITLEFSAKSTANNSWWSTVVAAVTGQEFEMEMLDSQSGFLRTAWRERSAGDVSIRRRYVGNVVQRDPLKWRIRYEVQTKSGPRGEWTNYGRGFREEIEAIEEIRGRSK